MSVGLWPGGFEGKNNFSRGKTLAESGDFARQGLVFNPCCTGRGTSSRLGQLRSAVEAITNIALEIIMLQGRWNSDGGPRALTIHPAEETSHPQQILLGQIFKIRSGGFVPWQTSPEIVQIRRGQVFNCVQSMRKRWREQTRR